eukprot:TRINITY_DN4241_c0_g1_i2.p1 TRINITY_DN4241_c0_g1~~TRINITY_DN4241_c0_g1_i2.p1  ORF type:complete len:377 (+),score=186.45 TRINITY_DN4241_c0_g1_i2:122-1252(+)
MAPKAAARQLKRRSSGAHAGEPALKKQMLEDSKVIAAAIKDADLPSGVIHLLTEAVPSCLTTFKDERHRYQESVVDMVGQAMGGLEEKLQKHVTDATKDLDSLDKDKLEEAVYEEARKRAVAKSTAAEKEADVLKAALKFRLKTDALKVKTQEQKADDHDYNVIDAKKAKVEAAMKAVQAAKEAAASKKEISSLESALKAVDIDTSLLGVLPNVISKDPKDRGEFDGVTLSNLDAELSKKLELVQAELQPLTPAKEKRAAEVAAAQADLDQAKEVRDAAKAAEKEAQAAVSAAEKSVEAACAAEKEFGHSVKLCKAKLIDAEKDLKKFREGPLATYNKLKDQTTPPPPAEKEEAPAAVEAAEGEAAAGAGAAGGDA